MSINSSDPRNAVDEQNQLVAEVLERKYGSKIGDRYFEVSSNVEGPFLEVKITLQNADKTFVYPIEGRIMFADQDLTLLKARDFLLDFMDAYVQEYLEEGEETYLTIDWSNYDCDGIELQMRGQILNLKLEEMANQFLAGAEILN